MRASKESSHHTRTISEQLGAGMVETGHVSSLSRVPVKQLQQRLSEWPHLTPAERPLPRQRQVSLQHRHNLPGVDSHCGPVLVNLVHIDEG